ncbi:DUF4189 domain-containing protein [Serratia sp. DD3]|uniref:DUF4189 domain-containing protein n=1 Tax=Serratia sp. DD3 TaxID=1410619 RepID=UPI0003C50D9D|nr:DUF4189 domain-containing protein [Serratia sp. DD3]KEY56446.1 hypothetical protein SRDD_44900 [Serratia sp. DD3]
MKKLAALLLLISMISVPILASAFDLNKELDDEAWDRINNASSDRESVYIPEVYNGVIYGNAKKGNISFNYGGDLSIPTLKVEALDNCDRSFGDCQLLVTWQDGCMAVAWSASKQRFFHTTPTKGLKLEDKAISSAMQACTASGAKDCKMKGEIGDQVECTYSGYDKKSPTDYRAIFGNVNAGQVWISSLVNDPGKAGQEASSNCDKNYGNCQYVVSWHTGCTGLAWSPSKQRFFYSPVNVTPEEQAVSSARQACTASGATDCKVSDQTICTSTDP